MSHLLDDQGNVYEQSPWGEWTRKEGWAGPEREVDWTGRPKIKHNLWGEPEPARDFWGDPIRSAEGKPLYRPASSTFGPPGRGGGDAEAAAALLGLLAGIGLFILVLYLLSTLISAILQVLAALFEGWRSLTRRYPRAMTILHLALGSALLVLLADYLGLPPAMQLAGAALVPLLWTWIWLTRRLPLVFIPINLVLIGAGLWWASEVTRPLWVPVWVPLTTGLPLVGNVSLLLAVTPTALWLWWQGRRRWPRALILVNGLAVGVILWFLTDRVWTDWRPFWDFWTAGLPLAGAAGWVAFLGPLTLWLWARSTQRWPVPFTVLNLLLFGGLLGLVADRTQPIWYATWRYWAAGLPFAPFPIPLVMAAPLGAWLWDRGTRRWPWVFILPNLLLAGGFLWLVTDRTRPLWWDAWTDLVGNLPVPLELPLLLLGLPLVIWGLRQGNQRWPHAFGLINASLFGLALWAVMERTRQLWELSWREMLWWVPTPPDPALMVGIAPPVAWLWAEGRRRWPRWHGWLSGALLLGLGWWAWAWLLPQGTLLLRAGLTLLPLVVWVWLLLLQRYPKAMWPLTLLPWAALALTWWLDPVLVETLALNLRKWLRGEGLPLPPGI
jgi:hypothetical protein